MINSFSGEHCFLSNFYPSPILVDGLIYPTVEHAYQAAKTLDTGEKLTILRCETPGKAKRFGRKVKIRPDWEENKIQIMSQLLKLKFSDEELRKKLLSTKSQILVEGNTWGDTFWGKVNGKGENWLGIILMNIREELLLS